MLYEKAFLKQLFNLGEITWDLHNGFNWIMDTLCGLQNDRLKLQGVFKAFAIKMVIITVGNKRKWMGWIQTNSSQNDLAYCRVQNNDLNYCELGGIKGFNFVCGGFAHSEPCPFKIFNFVQKPE